MEQKETKEKQKKATGKRRFHRHRGKPNKNREKIEKAEKAQKAEAVELCQTADESQNEIPSQVEESSEALENISSGPQTVGEENEKLYETVGIRFRPVGKMYTFAPADFELNLGDEVIVETSQGPEFGYVSSTRRMVKEKDLILPLKKVLRKADEKDKQRHEDNKAIELRARKIFLEKVTERGLDMALSDVECSFDKSKIIFYFTSEGRVDFREFVKDMAAVFKTRIELRQIGVRDEAKQLGGLGICGRPLCCASFLDDFQQVSIKMAKEQNLSLNPTKISGTCGRLMCCLRYENDVYVEASKHCPKADSIVMTPKGKGIVTEANILCGKCKVKLDSEPDSLITYSAEDLKVLPKQKKSQNASANGNDGEKKEGENQ